MIWPAAPSGAAPRGMRGTAGRRALHVMLLAFGVFGLGLLLGERAQAAEGPFPAVPAPGTAAGSKAVSGGPEDPLRHPRPPRPVAERGVGAVADRVLDSAGRTVEAVTGAAGVERVPPPKPLPPLPLPDSVPGLPGLPDVPGGAGSPALPGGSVVPPAPEDPAPPVPPAPPAVPVPPDHRGHPLPVPIEPPPQQGGFGPAPSAGAPTPASPSGSSSAHVSGRRAGASTATADTAHRTGCHHTASGGVPRTGGLRAAAPAGPPPGDRAPAGDPDGALGNRSAADDGTPRHGDAHAVVPSPQVPLGLTPGALVRTTAAEVRDRHRDAPVLPS